VLRVLIHMPTLWAAGFRLRPELDLRHPRLVELFRKMPMAIAGVAVAQVMISINKFFAMFMDDGYVTHLNNANHIAQLPLGILASAMATAILPQLTQFVHEDRRDELRSLFGFALRLLAILFLPAAVGLIVLGEPIVALLFQRLAWTSEATAGTAWALLFYAIGLLPAAGLRLATPLYYARLDLRTPVKAGIFAVCVNLALNFIFFKFTDLRQGGLALATTLAMTANLALLLYWMRGEVGGAFDRRLGETAWKCLIAAIIMGAIAKGLWAAAEAWAGPLDSFVDRASFIGVAIPLCAGAYIAIGAMMRIPDLGRAIGLLRQRRRGSGV
jgi:putative peptidoglycan lipid II flippase